MAYRTNFQASESFQPTKRSLSSFDTGMIASADANLASAEALASERDNGNHDISEAQISKARLAAKSQRALVEALTDEEKKALLRVVNVGMVASACQCSYSLEKVEAIAQWLAHGVDGFTWSKNKRAALHAVQRMDGRMAGEMYDLRKLRDNVRDDCAHAGYRQTDMSLIVLERMNAITRIKDGRTFKFFEINAHKLWEALSITIKTGD